MSYYFNPYYYRKKQKKKFFDFLDDNDGDFESACDDYFDDFD